MHASLSAMGGECVYAVEADAQAAMVYQRNWGINPQGDIRLDANDVHVNVPPHDLLAANLPLQPFSAFAQRRMADESAAPLYWNVLQIVKAHRPSIVLVETVRGMAGARHHHD